MNVFFGGDREGVGKREREREMEEEMRTMVLRRGRVTLVIRVFDGSGSEVSVRSPGSSFSYLSTQNHKHGPF